MPAELLGGVRSPTDGGAETARAVAELLRRADTFYRRGDRGLAELPASVGVAMRAARLIYAEIGRPLDEFFRMRRTAQETEVRQAMQFRVTHRCTLALTTQPNTPCRNQP